VVEPLTNPGSHRHVEALRSSFMLWLVLNGIAAFPFLERGTWFKTFLNPVAPGLCVILEALIILIAVLRYRRQMARVQDRNTL